MSGQFCSPHFWGSGAVPQWRLTCWRPHTGSAGVAAARHTSPMWSSSLYLWQTARTFHLWPTTPDLHDLTQQQWWDWLSFNIYRLSASLRVEHFKLLNTLSLQHAMTFKESLKETTELNLRYDQTKQNMFHTVLLNLFFSNVRVVWIRLERNLSRETKCPLVAFQTLYI